MNDFPTQVSQLVQVGHVVHYIDQQKAACFESDHTFSFCFNSNGGMIIDYY